MRILRWILLVALVVVAAAVARIYMLQRTTARAQRRRPPPPVALDTFTKSEGQDWEWGQSWATVSRRSNSLRRT